MFNFQKINNITGWLVFLIATIVYIITIEPTASFWDCGEFIACSYKLQIPHPPGAPLFLLIGRVFSLLATDVTKVAYWVNMVSVISSSATILFLFWTITILARKVVSPLGVPNSGQTLSILGAGIIGSLAFTFSDSFWFSAEEAEVYSMSSFFTAFVFWAILKWESKSEEPDSDKWLILIAYMIGLSIGVHILNLVALPAMAYVYYFKKYKVSTNGIVLTLLISGSIVVFILYFIIPGLPSIAGKFEIIFVNNFGTPFKWGIIFFCFLLIGSITYGIFYSIRHNKKLLNTALLSLTFILIGYASYGIILVRSNFNPPIDENDPENVITFVSYLKREQYGDRPLFHGPYFTAGYPIDAKQGDALYRQDTTKGEYVVYDYKMDYKYDPKHMTIFPRAYSNQPHHVEAYQQRMNLREGKKPTKMQDFGYMFSYQIGHMYWRYFLWNFAGRESDIQDAPALYPTDWFDKDLPEYLTSNKARNNYFWLPVLLGMLGLFFHFKKNKNDATVVLLLFFFTGIAIILYLNQPPVEPRERDYTFTGSFYAFAIWIGFGVLFLIDLLQKVIKSETLRPVIATTICLIVPGIMAAEGWDDHDRSGRFHSVDSAKNLLNSCAKNAILFTGGDNDTFPLWYVQEVEGFRTDVRVCNLSLLNTDWYISQMKRKAYESEALPITLEYKDFMQGKNDQVYYFEKPAFKNGINLQGYIQLVKMDHREIKQETGRGDLITILPSKNLFLNVKKEGLIGTGAIPKDLEQFITDKMTWTLNLSALEKKDLIMLDMIANNNWERPIYFSTTLSNSNFLNLKEYTQLEGLAHRLLPVKIPGATQGWLNTDIMYDNMTKNYFWRGLDNPKIYYDENYLRFPVNARSQFYRLAAQLLQEGKKEKAKEAIMYCLKVMPDNTIPYDLAIPPFISLLFKVDEEQKAMEICKVMGERASETLAYMKKQRKNPDRDYELNLYILDQIVRGLKEAGKTTEAAKYEEILMKYYQQ